MRIQTIARMYRVASARILGKSGDAACWYLGHAMADALLGPAVNGDPSWGVNHAKREFKRAVANGDTYPRSKS